MTRVRLLLLAATCSCLVSLTIAQCYGTLSTGNYSASWVVAESMEENVAYVTFEVSATTTNWVAIGFSDDQMMVS